MSRPLSRSCLHENFSIYGCWLWASGASARRASGRRWRSRPTWTRVGSPTGDRERCHAKYVAVLTVFVRSGTHGGAKHVKALCPWRSWLPLYASGRTTAPKDARGSRWLPLLPEKRRRKLFFLVRGIPVSLSSPRDARRCQKVFFLFVAVLAVFLFTLGDARQHHVRGVPGCLWYAWGRTTAPTTCRSRLFLFVYASRRTKTPCIGYLCTLRDARQRQVRGDPASTKELELAPFVTADQFKRWSSTGILCTPSMGAHAFRCDMTDSGSGPLVIIFRSRLLNLVLGCVCASFLGVCLGLSHSSSGVSLGCSIVGVGEECHWRFPWPPSPSPPPLTSPPPLSPPSSPPPLSSLLHSSPISPPTHHHHQSFPLKSCLSRVASAWKHWRSTPWLVLTAQEPLDGGGSDASIRCSVTNGWQSRWRHSPSSYSVPWK